jgi:hypothetical protein
MLAVYFQSIMNMQDFNTKIREWCPQNEFYEIYKINHPTENKNEVHFIKNGIRVCCVKNYDDLYFYLNAECFLKKEKEILTLKTGKYELFDTVNRDKLLILIEKKIKLVENRNNILFRISQWFNNR